MPDSLRIGQHLLFKDRSKALDRFDFYDHQPFDNQISAKAFIKFLAADTNRNDDLALDTKSSLLQRIRKHAFVDRLK